MLIPQITVQQAGDCHTLFLKDVTCYYDPSTCSCGFGGINPTKADITKTIITITTPGNQEVVLLKNYLPINPAPLTITCADMIISGETIVTDQVTNDCGCGTITTTVPSPVPSTCFEDGCYYFKYDVYASEDNVTYTYDLSSIFGDDPYPGYCTTIVVDGDAFTSATYLASEVEILNWLNTLSLGYFTLNSTDHKISVTSFSHTYGNLTTNNQRILYTFLFEECEAFSFPNTLTSVTISGTENVVSIPVTNWDDVVEAINNLGQGTFSSGGFSSDEGSIFAESCSAGTLDAIEFDTCVPGVEADTPTTTTFTPATETVPEETLVGTTTQQVFLYCNVNALRKSFKLQAFSTECGCTDSIQSDICLLDSNFDTMLIATSNTTDCNCECSTTYLRKVQDQLAALERLCNPNT